MPTKRIIPVNPSAAASEDEHEAGQGGAAAPVSNAVEQESEEGLSSGSGSGSGGGSSGSVPQHTPLLQSTSRLVHLPALVPLRSGVPPPAITKGPVGIDLFTFERNDSSTTCSGDGGTGDSHAGATSDASDASTATNANAGDAAGNNHDARGGPCCTAAPVCRTDLPLIALFGGPPPVVRSSTEEAGEKQPTMEPYTSPSAAAVSIGRRDVLMAYYRGCGCVNATDRSSSSSAAVDGCNEHHGRKRERTESKSKRLPLCADCRSVEDWATKFLSRQMVHLSPVFVGEDRVSDPSKECRSQDVNGAGGVDEEKMNVASNRQQQQIASFRVQVRGENAPHFVTVDGRPIVPQHPVTRPKQVGGSGDGWSKWRGDAILKPGDEISFRCPDGCDEVVEGGVREIVFRLVAVTVELGASTEEHGKKAEQPEKEKIVTVRPGLPRSGQDGVGADDMTEQPVKDETTHAPEKMTTPELSPVRDNAAIDLTESPPLRILDDTQSQQEVIDISSTEGGNTDEAPPRHRQCRVFFLQLGRSMSQKRVQALASNLQRKDESLQVVDAFAANAGVTHVVIDENVSPPQAASALGFTDLDQMRKVFTKRNILAVKPEWITKSSNIHDEPTLDEHWVGLCIAPGKTASRKRPLEAIEPKRETSTTSDASLAEDGSDDEFAPISVVKASSVKGDETVSRMLKKRKEVVRGEARRRNQGLFEMFMELSRLQKECRVLEIDDIKQKLYAKVAWRLRYLDFEVENRRDVLKRLSKVDSFGPSVMTKVKEYLNTGSCEKIHEFTADPHRVAVRDILKIWGVGRVKANELVLKNYRTVEDVRAGLSSGKLGDLSENARIGVELYDDLLDEMGRSEVEEIADIVIKAFREKYPKAEVEIMGSYRRGNESCGDCDLLIVDPDYEQTTAKGALGDLVDRLKNRGHISHHLTKVEGMEGFRKKKVSALRNIELESDKAESYMGVCRSPRHQGRHRRLDIKLYPYQDRAYAALYFTGNTAFNRSMRTYSQHRKNMSLNDHGLFPINSDMPMPHEKKKEFRTGRVDASSEEEIFDLLGLIYRGPTERKCFDDVMQK